MKASKDKKEKNTTQVAVKKKKGPLRLEAIAPVGIVFALIVAYGLLFFDFHLRRLLEYGLTLANGGEVNIASLHTRLLSLSLQIDDIEVTDTSDPALNLVQVGTVRFRMGLDPLLRGKIVIDDAEILDVSFHSKRKSPGFVLERKGGSPVDRLRKEFEGNVLGDIVAFAQKDDYKKELEEALQSGLKTAGEIETLEKELDQKKGEWQRRVDQMPTEEKIKALETRLKNVKLERFQNGAEVIVSLNELNSIRTELNTNVTAVQEAGRSVREDSTAFRKSFHQIDAAIANDLAEAQKRLQLPKIGAKHLSGALFASPLFDLIDQIQGYVDRAESYLPAKGETKSEEKSEPPVPRKRASGRDYAFGRPHGYPPFWLRHAKISITKAGKGSGISGEIENVTSHPTWIGKPLVITFAGNLPEQQLSKIRFRLVIDQTSRRPAKRISLEVGGYPVLERLLAKGSDATLSVVQATGSIRLAMALYGERIDAQIDNRYAPIQFRSEAASAQIQSLLRTTLSDLKAVTVHATATGSRSDLNVSISSNLGDAIAKGLQKVLSEKVTHAQKLIETNIRERIDPARKRLTSRYESLDGEMNRIITAREKAFDRFRSELDRAFVKVQAGKQSQKQNSVEERLKQEALDRLRKGF